MSKLNSKLMRAERIAASGKVIIPGLSQAQIVFVLQCLRTAELRVVEKESGVYPFHFEGSKS